MWNLVDMSTYPNLSAIKVADYIVATLCEQPDCSIDPLKLQKLLYYVQGYALGVLDRPVFPEAIEAWENGPVVQNVYEQYKNQRMHDPIDCRQVETALIPNPEDEWIINEVIRNFGYVDGSELSNYTHQERPWILMSSTGRHNAIINHQLLREYFKPRELHIRYENYPKPKNRYSMVELMKKPIGERNVIIADAQQESLRYQKEHNIDERGELEEPYWDE